jgi:hypothetical protein
LGVGLGIRIGIVVGVAVGIYMSSMGEWVWQATGIRLMRIYACSKRRRVMDISGDLERIALRETVSKRFI